MSFWRHLKWSLTSWITPGMFLNVCLRFPGGCSRWRTVPSSFILWLRKPGGARELCEAFLFRALMTTSRISWPLGMSLPAWALSFPSLSAWIIGYGNATGKDGQGSPPSPFLPCFPTLTSTATSSSPGSSPETPEPMKLGRTRLSPEKRECQMREGRCLYSGEQATY